MKNGREWRVRVGLGNVQMKRVECVCCNRIG